MTETSALSCAFIHNPYKIAKTGSHALGRQLRFSQQVESLAEYGMLFLAGDHKHTAAGIIQYRKRQCKAICTATAHILIYHDTLLFLDALFTRKK